MVSAFSITGRCDCLSDSPVARYSEIERGDARCTLRLILFLEYPELELSNDIAENSMRPVALGRKHWIHAGSETAGPKVAAILTVVETCRRLKIPVREYLVDILPGLANLPVQQVSQLTPAAWAASRSSK